MWRVLCLSIMLSLNTLATAHGDAPDLTELRYLTEDYPPFNYRHDDQIAGISIDLLRAIWQRTGVQRQKIELLPWARAYHELKLYPNTVLFAVAKTQDREPMFKWACPIVSTRYVLFAQKASNIQIAHASELNMFTIGTIRADVGEQALLGLMEEPINILSNVTMRPNLELMDKGRVHMIAYDELAAPQMLSEFGRDPEQFEIVFPIVSSVTCFAFNRKTDDAIVDLFQRQLSEITAAPEYQRLIRQHFQSPKVTP
ncbi:MAG: substrate-binding periplasmic protein [Aestuariibacter sp.]